jgi:hypothetical protein
VPKYRLRFFFDAGSGTCLWADNELTHERFDYPVDFAELPISENLRRRLHFITAWYDTGLDWSDPGGPSTWDAEESARFEVAARAVFASVQAALGPEFECVDEYCHTG